MNVPKTIFPYVNLSIDISLSALLGRGFLSLLQGERKRPAIQNQIHRTLIPKEAVTQNTIIGLSVRSLFDLYLQVMDFPKGSEIIMSAINIRDMERIVIRHGLVPVCCDLELSTLAPQWDMMEKLVNPKTVAILLAHLYGKTVDISPGLAIARVHGLKFIEDCAQCFQEAKHFMDCPSDIRLFSFGLIKYNTALGGGIALISDNLVREQMEGIQNAYPIQKKREFLRKILKATFLVFVLNIRPVVYLLLYLTYLKLFRTLESKITQSLRAFPTDVFHKIRHRPSSAQLYFLCAALRRMVRSDASSLRSKGDLLASLLPAAMTVPGAHAKYNFYWLFPVLVANRVHCMEALRAQGVYVFHKSSLELVGQESSGLPPVEARNILNSAVHLPFNKNMSEKAIRELAQRCHQIFKGTVK